MVGDPPNTYEVLVRGWTDDYRDFVNRLQLQAARVANRTRAATDKPYTPETLPPSISDICFGQALAAHILLDVRGIDGDDGPVTGDQYREYLALPEGHNMRIHVGDAANRVSEGIAADTEAAAGNSSPASDGT